MAESDLLHLNRVSKTFVSQQVLDVEDLTVPFGSVCGLLGANGSGKSTLVKILSGYHAPDSGAVAFMRGKPLRFPMKPRSVGIATVQQNLAFTESCSVVENFVASRRLSRLMLGPINWRREEERTVRSMADVGLHVDPRAEISSLTSAERALAAVARALEEIRASGFDTPLLILDEPTANLSSEDARRVLSVASAIAAAGGAVVLINHRLAEIRHACDQVRVLRDGHLVASGPLADLNDGHLMEAMFGESEPAAVVAAAAQPTEPPNADQEPLLTVRHELGWGFSLRPGEVVGVTGLVGMGQDELFEELVGLTEHRRVEVTVGGQRLASGPRAARARGLVAVPADRANHGVWLGGTVLENFTIGSLASFGRYGRLKHAAEREATRGAIADWRIVTAGYDAPIATLSGGNQQKVVVARAVASPSWRVLVAHEPTQGIDVSARTDILASFRQSAANDRAILICSADYEALAEVCDRVLVISNNVLVDEISRADGMTEESLAYAAMRPSSRAS